MIVVVVLGMHKSGTSLISETLHHSGIEMVDTEAEAAGTYDDGVHYERASTKALNKQLLSADNLHSLETVEPAPASATDPNWTKQARKLVEQLSSRGLDWGFKDPRTCLTYAVWKQLLPEHELVCVFRDVVEVFEHYRRVKRGGMKALHAWYVYNAAMLSAYESAYEARRHLLDYSNLMEATSGMDGLGQVLGRECSDRRNAKLRRSRTRTGIRANAALLAYKLRSGHDAKALNRRLKLLSEKAI